MPDTHNQLELSIHIAAKPSTVFRFLSDPKLFQQWMGTGAVLGANDITVSYPGGEVARGTIRASEPDRRLVFGWGYESNNHGLANDSTLVTIELTATADGGTTVTLTHSGLDAKLQSEHAKGWNYYLGQLAAHAGAIGIAERLPSIIDAYCAAWNETDTAKRRQALEQCWDTDAVFRDQMGAAEGLDSLDRYIAGAHQFLPGFRLESAGKPDLVRGFVRFPWVIRVSDGSVMSRGANFGELGGNGKFRFVTGFWDANM